MRSAAPILRRWVAAAALVTTASTAAPQQDAEVDEPLPEVPASIVCIPGEVAAAGVGGETSILSLSVRNPFDRPVEPLSFRLSLPGPPERELWVARVPLPHVGRVGRPVAPGGREEYVLAVPRPVHELREYRAVVETAVFFEAEPSAIESARLSGIGTRAGEDVVQIENGGSLALDLVLEVTYGAARARSLHPVRLEPKERLTWDVPPPVGWRATDGSRQPRAIDARLVDECALELGDEGDEGAREALVRAYTGWIGERSVADGAAGLFEFDHRSGRRTMHARGRFEIVGDGVAVVPHEPWERPEHGALAREALEQLFDLEVRRPSLEDVVDRAEPRRLAESKAETVLGLESLPAIGVEDPALIGLRDDRIAWTSGPTLGEAPHLRWLTRPFGAGYLRVGIDRYEDLALDPQRPDQLVRWSFDDVPGPRGTRRPLPVELRRREVDERGRIRSATRLAISWLGDEERLPGSDARDDPAARAALREAWERPLRYGGPRTWRGRCEVLAAEPRAAWNGRDWVSGTFRLEELRSGGWTRCTFVASEGRSDEPTASTDELAEEQRDGPPDKDEQPDRKGRKRDQPPLDDPATRRALADGVEERLAAWTRLDFAHRPPFDLLFGNATVQRLGSDLVIEGSPIRRVRIEDGLPVLLIEADGTRIDLEFLILADAVLPVRVQRRGRQLEIQHALVGDEWLPRRLVLTDFPPLGGLETLLLEGWRR